VPLRRAREIQVGRFSPTINVNLNISLSGQADLLFLAPTYTFATPVLGGQLSATVASVFGRNAASLAGTLTGPLGNTFSGTLQDSLTSYGDLYPTLKLKWNQGVNNYMVYAAGDIPVGDYNSMRLANLGIGHGAIDVGGGYTYFNPATGKRIFRRRRLHLQLHQSGYKLSERHRLPFRLGHVALPVEAVVRRPRRLRLPADYRRLRSKSCF